MADNMDVTPGTGKTIGADDISSVLYQRIKLIHGADGTNDGDVSDANPLPIDDAGGSLTVDGTVTANLSATDNAVLDTIDAVLDTINAKLVTGTVIGDVNLGATDNAVLDDIATKLGTIDADTGSIKTAVEVIDNAISGTEMQVDVVAALPAGTNAIGKLAANSGVDIGDVDILSIAAGDNNIGNVDVVTTSLDKSINGAGAPTIDSYTTDDVNLAANTANQSVVAAPGESKQIWVYGLMGTVDVAGSISIQDEDDTALSGVMPVDAKGGFVVNPSGNFAMPWIKVATNKALEIDTVTCTFDGIITYAIVSV